VKYVPSSMAVKGQEAVVSGSVGYGQAGTWRGCECTRCPVARGSRYYNILLDSELLHEQ
jgi:hypothetical protein